MPLKLNIPASFIDNGQVKLIDLHLLAQEVIFYSRCA